MLSFRLTTNNFLWISSNFGKAFFIDGALQHGKFLCIIQGLFHKKYMETRKNIPDIDDRNRANAERYEQLNFHSYHCKYLISITTGELLRL